MNAVLMMLGVTVCYTICSLSDKYAIVGAKLSGDEFTFVMCSSMSVFLALILPFQNVFVKLDIRSIIAVVLIALCKMFEFQMSARVLKELSAFELKAWLGLSLFASYFTDICYGERPALLPIVFICLSAIGLVLIARSGASKSINYKKIALPLFLYIMSKYSYGLVVKAFTPYISSTLALFAAFLIISLILLIKIDLPRLFREKGSGVLKVALVRIPNTVGMLLENAVIAVSLSDYAFIQPMILAVLFFIGLLRREKSSLTNILGGIICVIGIVCFQLFR